MKPTKWKLVPVEPTLGMEDAADRSRDSASALKWTYANCYQSMLEAAPQPPKLSDERIYQVWGEQAEKTIGKSHSEFLVSFVRAIESEILGGNE